MTSQSTNPVSSLKLPHLRIVPVERVIPHEHHDPQRAEPLMRRIQASGVFRDPPLVMPLQDETGRFMILDGTNRVTAIRRMGLPHILVQVVPPDDPHVSLKTWNHLLWGLSSQALLAAIRPKVARPLKPVAFEEGYQALHDREVLLLISLPDGQAFALAPRPSSVAEALAVLNRVVEAYLYRASLDRTVVARAVEVRHLHPDLAGIVVFPPFSIPQVLDAVAQGHRFPAGITRFTVAPRALRLHYPLERLAAAGGLEDKNRELQQWLQERLARKAVRYYAEPTVLFDE